jgi:hypothetical protein
MKRMGLSVTMSIAALLFAIGCGSSSGSQDAGQDAGPTDSGSQAQQDCQNIANVSCQKLFQCYPSDAGNLGFASQADCAARGYFGASDNSPGGGCQTISPNPCSGGRAYSSANANACATAIGNTSCAAFYPGSPVFSSDGGMINAVCGQICQ